jgi:hypothetical protein
MQLGRTMRLCCNVREDDALITGWAVDLGFCVAFALLLWAPLGRRILAGMGKDSLPDSGSLSISLGIGCWGFAVLALGLVGLLYRVSLLLFAATLFVACRLHGLLLSRQVPSGGTPAGQEPRIPVFVMTVLSGVFIALVFCSAPAPELAFDALNVHLPYARDAAAAHRAGFAPNNWSSVMPALPLMSYITAFVLSGLTLAKLFNVLCYVLCGGVVFGFVRRRNGILRASAAALLFWSSPIALYEATTALIDLPLALYSAIAGLSFLEWTAGNNRKWLWLSAVGLGLAFGCKYHAAFWLAPLSLILLFETLSRCRMTPGESLLLLARYILVVMLLLLPWLVRAWVYTGNPVFPVANSVFRSPMFPPAMEAAARAMYANEGVGTSLPALLKLPLALTFHPGPFRGTPGILFLPGVILALVRGRNPQVRYGLVMAAFYFLTWALTAQEIRYLLPLMPLLSVLAATGFLGEARAAVAPPQTALNPIHSQPKRAWRGTTFGRIGSHAGVLIVVAGSVMSLPPLYPVWVREWTYWHSYQSPIPYLSGRQTEEEYLRHDVPSIYVYDFVNRTLSPQDRILLLNDASQYYSRIPTLYSFTVEGEALLRQTTEQGVLEKLKESHITHVLLNYNGIAPLHGVAPRLGVYFFLDKSFQERHLDVVFAKNNVVLYKVRNS